MLRLSGRLTEAIPSLTLLCRPANPRADIGALLLIKATHQTVHISLIALSFNIAFGLSAGKPPGLFRKARARKPPFLKRHQRWLR